MLSFGRFSGRAPFVQRPRTPAFHAGNTGSNPVRGTSARLALARLCLPPVAERTNDRIPNVGRWTADLPPPVMHGQERRTENGPRGSGSGLSGESENAENLAAGITDCDAPREGSFGERYPWLIAYQDKRLVCSWLPTRAGTVLRRMGCSTWGDLARLSEDALRIVPGVGETTIRSLHRTLEFGPLRFVDPPVGTATAGTELREKHGWMDDVANEQIETSLFDARTSNALRRHNIGTWGQLGLHSDESLLNLGNVGTLTVRRLNDALSAYEYTGPKRSREFANTAEATSVEHRRTAPAAYDLQASSEWFTTVSGDGTLGGLLAAIRTAARVPDEVSDEVNALLAVPLSQLSDHDPVPLGELIQELFSHAGDPELLEARMCARVRPTLETLGKKQGLTRERIRQKIAKDAELVLSLLESEKFRAVRWAAEQLQVDFRPVIPSGSEFAERWRMRLGERRFEMLRWASGYIYEDDWLLQDSNALADLETALGDAIRDEWLVKADELVATLSLHVHPDVALSFIVNIGQWRDIGDGWLVRWDGAIQHKAERVLRLTCRPMTPEELIQAVGHGSVGSLKNQHGSTLIRIDKEFRLALREWGYEEYEGITTEIGQRIDRGGGIASVSAILEEFVSDFGVKEGSVRAYLEAGPYIISGDEVRHLANRGYTPSSVAGRQHAIQIGDKWGQRFIVSDANLKGYSFNLDRDIAAHNGLQPDDSLVVPATHASTVVGEASLIWRLTNISGTVDVGRLSSVLSGLGIGEGDEIVIMATPESCAVLRAEETRPQQRSDVSDDIRRSLLGRK